MRHRLLAVAAALVTLLVGQTAAQAETFTWAGVKVAGPVGSPLNLSQRPPALYTIHALTTGTAPTTCTFEVESSPDGVSTHFDAGAKSLTNAQDCSAVGLATATINKPANYIRINVTAFTGGDSSTLVTFTFERGYSF
jgi:hypothetical protein